MMKVAAYYLIFLPCVVSSFLSPVKTQYSFSIPPSLVTKRARGSTCIFSTNFPTLDQLSKDPFMKQVTYASEFIPFLLDESVQKDLTDMISAQLSHSDGIRGFFVSYLTSEGSSPADAADVPGPVATALKRSSNRKELISLVCMNVIMPTGMITLHKDEEMSRNSAMTSDRGKTIAKYFMNLDDDIMKGQVSAILDAARGKQDGSDDVRYWVSFFEKWGYGEKEIQNIAEAFRDIQLDASA
mmetsp:Transcript_4770/g.9110  ORF Transcript_4770/g.9110 Transcript_4770/m.9110 type:complete len:241 (+) Transcript_4770:71-793(+)|eukprot:CAMPEP_0176482134 /NCGR_PEP_ID=MMETSP0200_2-20121128/3210_1 /TAXON_ID=947934 /ORGANISM="Chaetoceros sp., Strain GSL56" /LENGTH=240 /DNA_ID=CAMNT_0017878423 /DNA_START=37 /DNA_END=759 /DNA_ORIENTATION=-